MTEILEAREVQPVDDPDVLGLSGSSTPTGPMHYRSAELLEVRFPDRMIEVVAHPYEQEAIVNWDGRIVTEVCERGAYEGIERRANRVKVNRDHDIVRTVGRAHALHPSRSVGLVAELHIARTPLGDETLELASDGVLDASVGYRPMPGGEAWSRDRRQVRLRKCWLGHIAMVPEPAYEGANVLAVRAAPPVSAGSATPILDRILAERMAAAYHLGLT